MKPAYCVPVLMYHHVSPSAGMITTSPRNFERQIAGLARAGYHALTADAFAGFLAGEPVPDKSLLITFDDGYLDNYVYAHPVLQRYGMHGIIFLITGLIGDGPARPFNGQGGQLPATPEHRQAKALLAAGATDSVMLRWSEVKAMREAGTFEFHSHTHTHTRWDLENIPRDQCLARMTQEFADSRAALTRHLGSVSAHFCWPQGHFDADYVRLAKQAGFEYLYTTIAHGQNLAGGDPACIYRFAVRNRGFPWLRQRAWLASHPVIGPLYNRWKSWKRARRAS
ncbi:MAG: polysaccharide deacetylase family protein [Burkholderiaceae bacterium]|nr:polysaccharide deacetylase family protein [Burkholderiaceae bacterium]